MKDFLLSVVATPAVVMGNSIGGWKPKTLEPLNPRPFPALVLKSSSSDGVAFLVSLVVQVVAIEVYP